MIKLEGSLLETETRSPREGTQGKPFTLLRILSNGGGRSSLIEARDYECRVWKPGPVVLVVDPPAVWVSKRGNPGMTWYCALKQNPVGAEAGTKTL